MERILNLAGKNSSEIFQLRYPFSLLSFCDYDLSYFAENAIAVCDEALRSGELDFDRVTDLRNSLKNMHVYIEHNLRTVYEKIVLDCWIDYVCRRDNVGTSALWNRFIDCKTAFEKAVFVRLCEYRYNKAINEWLNLVRVQDYAKNKVYFLFSKELSGVEEANARRNYFDLMFSVTARELGCRLEDLGVTQVFSAGRLPSAPFMYPNISKDIIKNLLADFDYSDDYSDIGSYDSMSDQIAMDAFAHMKPGLAQELSSYNMSRSAMEHTPKKIYMPCGLKAAVDLEIDALLESGGWLARCKRCGRYYVRDSEYTEEYCSLPNPGGRTCLELYEMEHPRSRVTPEMERQCDEITDEMYSRVNSGGMSLKEYESWKLYLEAMKEKVNNGEIQPDDLTSFISYSKTMDISRSNPVVEVRKKEPERPQERVVRPFVPERISRSEIEHKPEEKPEEPEIAPQPQQRREGFFTSPSVERQKSQGRGQVSHIIRGGEPQPFSRPQDQPESYSAPQERGFTAFSGEDFRPAEQPERVAPEKPQEVRKAAQERGFTAFSSENFRPAETERVAPEKPQEIRQTPQEHGFTAFSSENFRPGEPERITPEKSQEVRQTGQERGFTAFSGEDFSPEEPAPEWTKSEDKQPEPAKEPEQPATPKPKVIRKNAAAISAYGKIAGTPLSVADSGFSAVSRPEEQPQPPTPETQPPQPEEIDPFDGLESIFDLLDQSESDMSLPIGSGFGEESVWEEAPQKQVTSAKKPETRTRKQGAQAAAPEPQDHSDKPAHSGKRRSSAETSPEEKPEVPSGIWTEERHLFPQEDAVSSTHEELNMLKEKKRGRSSKTQRLFDAIMREPDDNPNFRKK